MAPLTVAPECMLGPAHRVAGAAYLRCCHQARDSIRVDDGEAPSSHGASRAGGTLLDAARYGCIRAVQRETMPTTSPRVVWHGISRCPHSLWNTSHAMDGSCHALIQSIGSVRCTTVSATLDASRASEGRCLQGKSSSTPALYLVVGMSAPLIPNTRYCE